MCVAGKEGSWINTISTTHNFNEFGTDEVVVVATLLDNVLLWYVNDLQPTKPDLIQNAL